MELDTSLISEIKQSSTTPINLFAHVRARYGVLWLVLGVIIQVIVGALLALTGGKLLEDKLFGIFISLVTVQGMLVLWALTETRRAGISLKLLFFGRGLSFAKTWKHLLMVVPAFLFSIGSLMLVAVALGWILGVDFNALIEEKSTTLSAAPNSLAMPIVYYAFIFILVLIIAPITEELAFRGMLINRWGLKWGLGKAIIISSICFGLVHGITALETFVFALILSLIYLKTRSLVPGILFHAANNLIPFFAIISESYSPSDTDATASVLEALTLGAILVSITLPIIVIYIYKNWPRKGDELPYMHNDTPVLEVPVVTGGLTGL